MDYQENWREEKQSVYLYALLSKYEKNPVQSKLYLDLAGTADKQADIWAQKIISNGQHLPTFIPSMRARVVATLITLLPPRAMRPLLAAMKIRGLSNYSYNLPPHPAINEQDLEEHHKSLRKGGNFRAAVFGANDGLLSNASLILGMAGATSEPKIILLAGIAGLLAGAFSMASGEYISVRSQREMYEYQISLEAEELKHYPNEEAEELALIYQARGIETKTAQEMAAKIIENPESALQTLAREELGLVPSDLGSPIGAAVSSFLSFTLGALIPLFPFAVTKSPSLIAIIVTVAVALVFIGTIISLFTGKNALFGGIRMLLIGGFSGLITFLIGKLLGFTVF